MNTKQIEVGEFDSFTMFARARWALNPDMVTEEIDIEVTGNLSDDSQKNFELLIQSIAMRATPISNGSPVPCKKLEWVGSANLTGEGFVWKFSVDQGDVFTKILADGSEDPVGLLNDELNGIVLPTGVVIDTSSTGNVEIVKTMRKG